MKEKIDSKAVKLYSLWFDIKNATCFIFNRREKLFVPILNDSILNSVSEFQVNQ